MKYQSLEEFLAYVEQRNKAERLGLTPPQQAVVERVRGAEKPVVIRLGAGRQAPVWSEQEQRFLPVTEAQLTLSFDHRILDGGAAGRLLHRIATLMQKPAEL